MASALFPGAQALGAPGGQPNPQQRGPYKPLRDLPPVRSAPEERDKYDGDRITHYLGRYQSQTELLLVRDRQIEYNVRMLCGQQHNVWDPTVGRFFDTATWFTDDERRWRQLPVINKLLRWYVITHARLTENPPILSFVPGPDRADALLAEVLDALFKLDWRRANMDTVHDELMMWVVTAGRAHAISRLDLTRGEWRMRRADTPIPLLDGMGQPLVGPDGQRAMTPEAIPDVPLDAYDEPTVGLAPNGQVIPIGEPHYDRQGGVAVDVFSPLQVRGEWGPTLWHDKRWHAVQRFLSPEQVFETWGVEVEPDLSGQDASNLATLERVLFGAGFYGAAMGRLAAGWADERAKGALCTVYEFWEKPLPWDERLLGTWAEPLMETPQNPGGRHLVFTPKGVIRDGAREVAWPYVSPVRCFDFVRLPGRPTGTSPVEMLIGPQRAYNRSRGQAMEHAALLGNPQVVIDDQSGIQESQITNRPGKVYTAVKREGVKAVEYVAAPPISSDVYKAIEYAGREIDELGQLYGTEGTPPTADASGELVSQLRYNSDRFIGPTARRAVSEYGRLAEDWRVLYKLLYTAEEVIAVAGEDHAARTVTVLPDLFDTGMVNVQPDAESMLPESRGERQARATGLWQAGAFGEPASPEAREIYLEQARFPNYSRLHRPGGVSRVQAEQENGMVLQGQLELPIFDFYDHVVHLDVHERFMRSPEFLKLDPAQQEAFAFHRFQHLLFLQLQMEQLGTVPPSEEAGPPGGPGPSAQQPGSMQDSKNIRPGEPTAPRSVQRAGGRAPTVQASAPSA